MDFQNFSLAIFNCDCFDHSGNRFGFVAKETKISLCNLILIFVFNFENYLTLASKLLFH